MRENLIYKVENRRQQIHVYYMQSYSKENFDLDFKTFVIILSTSLKRLIGGQRFMNQMSASLTITMVTKCHILEP